MRIGRWLAGAACVGLLATGCFVPQAAAQEELFIPLPTYRTGPYAGSGIHIANGMHDYLTMLNERDGGIGGVPIRITECETGYDTQKGVECYQGVAGDDPLFFNPWSTGIALQVIPRASVDGIPVLNMAYGLSAAAEGELFPWVFNPPATYWDGVSVGIKHMAEVEGGMEALAGKKIGYIFLDAGYGREPIPLLEALSAEYDFELLQYPVPGQQMQNQSSIWLNIRRDRPDWIFLQGWGAMNPTAIQEAVQIRFPMDRMVGIWWSGGEADARAAGEGATGYKHVSFNAIGPDYPALQDILTHVVEPGLSQVDSPDRIGEALYNRGVYNSVLMAEAVRAAQEATGNPMVTPADVRDALETLTISEERWAEIGLEGFAPPLEITCQDHSGHHPLFVAEWDGQKWVQDGEWTDPLSDFIQPISEAAAKEYIAANPAMPKREQPCS